MKMIVSPLIVNRIKDIFVENQLYNEFIRDLVLLSQNSYKQFTKIDETQREEYKIYRTVFMIIELVNFLNKYKGQIHELLYSINSDSILVDDEEE